MLLRDLPSTFFNFSCSKETFLQLPSSLGAAGRHPSTSVNLLWIRESFCEHLSTFLAAWQPSINFCHHSVWPGGLPSTSINFGCSQETFRKLTSTSMWQGDLRHLLVHPVDHLSTFCVNERPSLNLCQPSV